MQPNTTQTRRIGRTQFYMIIVLAVILTTIAWLYIRMQTISTERAAQHKHSFYEYVVSRHIGRLKTIDTGTGLDPTS
jgi:hypothetical protein